MKPKPENPVIAIETFKTTMALLQLPATVEGTQPKLKVSVHASAAVNLVYDVIEADGVVTISEVVSGKPVPFTTSPNIADALTNIIFGSVSYIIGQCNEKAVADYVKAAGQEHSVFCENCRQLVPASDYGSTACKSCEQEQ